MNHVSPRRFEESIQRLYTFRSVVEGYIKNGGLSR